MGQLDGLISQQGKANGDRYAALIHKGEEDTSDWLGEFVSSLQKDFNPDEPRDDHGEWTSGGSDRESWPDHVKAMKVPPGWTGVEYSRNPHAKLQVTGYDKAGRKQYLYHPDVTKSQAEAKFARISEMNQKFESMVKQNDANMKSSDSRTSEYAKVVGLIMDTGIRPGSEEDTGAKTKAYGATTLEGRHVVVGRNGTSLVFTGKKGVALNIAVSDPDLANMLQARAKEVGPNGQLFPDVTDRGLRDYVHTLDGGDFKTKDFRSLIGTRLAMDEIRGMRIPKTEIEYRKSVMAVAKTVSTKLGNTPTVALQSYINPAVFAEWRAQ